MEQLGSVSDISLRYTSVAFLPLVPDLNTIDERRYFSCCLAVRRPAGVLAGIHWLWISDSRVYSNCI